MDMGQIGGNLIKVFAMLAALVGVIGTLFLGLFILGLILGIIFDLVLSGTIAVSTSTNTTLSKIDGNFSNIVDSVLTGATTAGSLIVVAVVLLLFGGIVYLGAGIYQNYKKGKGGSGGGY